MLRMILVLRLYELWQLLLHDQLLLLLAFWILLFLLLLLQFLLPLLFPLRPLIMLLVMLYHLWSRCLRSCNNRR